MGRYGRGRRNTASEVFAREAHFLDSDRHIGGKCSHDSRIRDGASGNGRCDQKQLLQIDHAGDATRLHRYRKRQRRKRFGQWTHQALVLVVLTCGLSCTRHEGPQSESPQAILERVSADFRHGLLKKSQDEAHQYAEKFQLNGAEWAWKFGLIEAEAALWRGFYNDALKLLTQPRAFNESSLAIHALTLQGIAQSKLHNFDKADLGITEAERLCAAAAEKCGEVIQARGLIAHEQGKASEARQKFEASREFARAHGDAFLESTSLLNLGAVSLTQEHFDEAMDFSEAAFKASSAIGAGNVALVAQANIGWAYYMLGDGERALQMFVEKEKIAADPEIGDVFDQENELTNMGYVYMEEHKFDLAARSFQNALGLAESIGDSGDIYNALRVLARFKLLTNNTEQATEYASRAQQIARQSGNHGDELYPMLIQAQVAARRGTSHAENSIREVEHDKDCPFFLKWEAEHSLAELYELQHRRDAADREYRVALATFEAARTTVRREDIQLSFLANGWRIYDDYVHFLIEGGKAREALRWADYSRARSLAEGLGVLRRGVSVGPARLDAQDIARRANATVLFYWLGERQSYLWAVTSKKTSVFPLPPAEQIDAGVQRYQRALASLQDVLQTGNADGLALYHTLVAPAADFFEKGGSVLIIPDGSLNSLNFESLLVREPRPHYWIEDAVIRNASSLRMVSVSQADSRTALKRASFKLLLVGDPVPPNPEFGRLRNASLEMTTIGKHFAAHDLVAYAKTEATPSAYLDGGPEQFSHIHFVAHGTASRLSPLDSAVILSQPKNAKAPFKLYARDIIQHPLHAELVTISTCFGSGTRAYAGEGLVGLSWAFLRAGAHNVIGALWEADDTATPRLMDDFYDQLTKGQTAANALRSAKLGLLHSESVFRKPYYWAPFQLYTRS
jgi:CHAT domain-containing protein/Tfp pilus assembly protein PilF